VVLDASSAAEAKAAVERLLSTPVRGYRAKRSSLGKIGRTTAFSAIYA
jgi:hypothetical protein